MVDTHIPTHTDLMWPTVTAIRSLGGSGRIDEISEAVIDREGYTEEQQAVRRRPDDNITMLDYRLAWARNYLKNSGVVENSARGVWALTEFGQEVTAGQLPDLVRQWKREMYQASKQGVQEPSEDIDVAAEPDDWKSALLSRLLEIPPAGFERLAQRLLREAGFRNVEVLGRTGDGGIDGVGVYRVSLVSFPIYFQCKRYKGSVSSNAVRDFRGAMSGRGEKGLLITTGSFTRSARDEATRDGAPPVELVSGDDLCDLLKQYELGVVVESRTVEDVSLDSAFFEQF